MVSNSRRPWHLRDIINSLQAHGKVPADRRIEAVNILELTHANLYACRKDIYGYRSMFSGTTLLHNKVVQAMEENNLLRARTLLVQWEFTDKYKEFNDVF